MRKNPQREAFEAFVRSGKSPVPPNEIEGPLADGSYRTSAANAGWAFWQAAQAAGEDRTIHDLVDQLEACGVMIAGRDKVLALGSSYNWPAYLALIAMVGVRDGVLFFRANEDVSNMQLDRILGRYPFSDEQRDAIVNNILLDPNAPKEPTFRVLSHQP